MINFFKKYFSKKAITENLDKSTYFSGIKKYLRSPNLWQVNCHSLARGVAIGLFCAVLPIVPFQTVFAILICFMLGGNLPFAFLVSWINNPVTYLPIMYFTYKVGKWVLPAKSVPPTLTYLLGLAIVSSAIAIFGYVTTVLIWKLTYRLHARFHHHK